MISASRDTSLVPTSVMSLLAQRQSRKRDGVGASDLFCGEFMEEQWKAVPGREGRYEVSNIGNVRSLLSGRVLRMVRSRDGYFRVSLGTGSQVFAHRLVLLAFVGPCPPGHQCAHRNGIPDDNRLENLRWATCKENIDDKKLTGSYLWGEQCLRAKLTEQQASEIFALRGTMASHRIGERYGVAASTVKDIHLGVTWRHLQVRFRP